MAALHGEGKLVIPFHADAGLGPGGFLDGFQQSLPVASSFRGTIQLTGQTLIAESLGVSELVASTALLC
jgi:hypothetical protein